MTGMADCSLCKHAIMDYADGYGGGYWFVDDCGKELDNEDSDCPEFEEWEDNDG